MRGENIVLICGRQDLGAGQSLAPAVDDVRGGRGQATSHPEASSSATGRCSWSSTQLELFIV